jgi:hypothetical protein
MVSEYGLRTVSMPGNISRWAASSGDSSSIKPDHAVYLTIDGAQLPVQSYDPEFYGKLLAYNPPTEYPVADSATLNRRVWEARIRAAQDKWSSDEQVNNAVPGDSLKYLRPDPSARPSDPPEVPEILLANPFGEAVPNAEFNPMFQRKNVRR